MRAMIHEAHGGPGKLALVDAPRPTPRGIDSGHPLGQPGAAWPRTMGERVIDVAREPA